MTSANATSATTDQPMYTCYAAYTRRVPALDHIAADTTAAITRLTEQGVTVRGLYDVGAMPAGADLLVWVHGPVAEDLQEAVRVFEHEAFGDTAELTWSAMGVHRMAEFNRRHAPAFLNGAEPKRWLTVYPFVRSYEWYLLPDKERRDLLVEHGQAGREFPQVLSNTVAAFALGDYEWLLGLEADELVDLVDLMRHLRASGARRHVRVEIPFYTGRRVTPEELAQVLR